MIGTHTRKGGLTINLVLLCGTILLSGVVCGVIAVATSGFRELNSVVVAVGIALIVSVFALVSLHRHGPTPKVILAMTAIRIIGTSVIAGFAAWTFPSLRTLTFFLSVTVVYMAGLLVETWLVWKDQQRHGRQAPQG